MRWARLGRNLWHDNTRVSAAFLFVLYALVTVYKAPELFSAPRFWAEDGVIYYLQAQVLPTLEALWAMPLGYLSLPANLAGILASQLPLLYAPYAGLAVSLLVQLLLCGVIIANRYFAGQRLWQGLLLLVPVLVIQSFETWLNPINSQVWLALMAAYVAAAPAGPFSAGRHITNALVLALAGASGVVTAFVAPILVLRGLWERQWFWLAYAMLASIGVLILLVSGGHGRPVSFPLDIFAVRSFLQLLLDNTCFPCALWLSQYPALLASGYFAVAALLLLALGYVMVWQQAAGSGRWLLLASLVLLLLSFAGALGKEQWLSLPPHFGGRYFFAPAALFFSSLLFMPAGKSRALAAIMLGIFCLNGVLTASQLEVVGEQDGKRWQASVKAFQQGQTSVIYFNAPFCGFVPPARLPPPPPRMTGHSPTEISVEAAGISALKQAQVYLYRMPNDRPTTFQRYSGGWTDSALYLFGTEQFGYCYGGDQPRPASGIRINGQQILVDRPMLGELSGYRFLFGYGENFAAMLANQTFVMFSGDEIVPLLK